MTGKYRIMEFCMCAVALEYVCSRVFFFNKSYISACVGSEDFIQGFLFCLEVGK